MYVSALIGFRFIVIAFCIVAHATFSSSLTQASQQIMCKCEYLMFLIKVFLLLQLIIELLFNHFDFVVSKISVDVF
jgi:hypothetical protein